MKRFDFPLERVRRWRAEQASVEELKLQQLRAELTSLQAAQRQLETEIVQSAQKLLEQPSFDPIELSTLDSYRLYLRYRIRESENLQRQCDAKIAAQSDRVLEARRQFELLDKLHNKAFSEWRDAGNKEQEEMAAELFLAKTVRDRAREPRAIASPLRSSD
jgi:hypothetical protein